MPTTRDRAHLSGVGRFAVRLLPWQGANCHPHVGLDRVGPTGNELGRSAVARPYALRSERPQKTAEKPPRWDHSRRWWHRYPRPRAQKTRSNERISAFRLVLAGN
jgi:hypothetical protein